MNSHNFKVVTAHSGAFSGAFDSDDTPTDLGNLVNPM